MALRKPLSLMTNSHHFATTCRTSAMAAMNTNSSRANTAASAVYPPPFTAVIKALDYANRQKGVRQWRSRSKPLSSKAWSTRTLKRIHQNLAHPPQKRPDLTIENGRSFRSMGGASEAVIRAAEQMFCRTCEKSSRAKTSRPAQLAVVLDFNEVTPLSRASSRSS